MESVVEEGKGSSVARAEGSAFGATSSRHSAGLSDLLARVEAATGADRALDRDLYWTLERTRAERTFHQAALGLPKPIPAHFGWHDLPAGLGRTNVASAAPAYTASLDAALALVERVLPSGIALNIGASKTARLWPLKPATGSFEGIGRTPALALLAALLKALITQEERR